MREMKDSGIEWVGIIPKSWNISRLKYIAKFFNGDRGKNYPSGEDLVDDGIAFLTSNNIHGIVLDCSQEKSKFITEERYNRLGGAKIQLNDIAFCLRGSVGNCAINKTLTKGTVASSLMIIRPIKASPDFINYVLQTDVCDVQTIKAMNGSCAANLSAENVSNYYFVEPPIVEQKKITIFLDSKCSEIDAISADIQKEIKTLEQYKRSVITEAVTKGLNPDAEMKDSGNLRIGVTPAHWNVHKIKPYIASFSSGLSAVTSDNSGIESGKFVLRTSAVSTGVFKSEEVKSVLESAVDRLVCPVEPDTLVMSRMNTAEMVGYCAYITKPYPDYYLPDKLWKIRMQPSLNTKYAWFVINSSVSHAWFASVATGASLSMLNISRTDFENLVIPVPPREEQDFIADFLDRKCSMTNDIILDKKHQLEVLDLYKKSLIYEYITGKKEVPAQN